MRFTSKVFNIPKTKTSVMTVKGKSLTELRYNVVRLGDLHKARMADAKSSGNEEKSLETSASDKAKQRMCERVESIVKTS